MITQLQYDYIFTFFKLSRQNGLCGQAYKNELLLAIMPATVRSFACGAGGSRTLVQTGKPYAFYTLIPAFGFRAAARPGPPTATLSSKFHQTVEARPDYFRFTCTA